MSNYFLRLEKTKEYLNLGNKGDITVSHLFLASTILEAYFPIMEKDNPSLSELQEALCEFNALLGNGLLSRAMNGTNNDYVLFPAPVGLLPNSNRTHEMIIANLLREIKLLHYSVVNWIDKKNFPQSNTHSDSEGDEIAALMLMQQNLLISPAKPFILFRIARHHESDSLLALAWTEVWYAIENNIQARCCPYCGVVFPLPSNNPQKATCLRPACKQKYEIDRHGGIESYREWERNRKKVPSKRSPGRPKKQKEGE
jgi:hypothetical protein